LNPDGTTDALFDQVALCPVMLTAIIKLGMDYFASKKNPWALLLQDLLTMKISLTITSYLKNASNEVDSIVNSTSDGQNKWKNGN
jgi:hypothetical protein